MVQRIDYAVFPEIRETELLMFTQRVLGHLQRSSPTFKALRDWLREANAWDKDTVPVILDLLDVQIKGADLTIGPWATQFIASDDDEIAREFLFKRLLSDNTLLVKYVVEALDMEGGGRLHSTYELHRMLTSYVYPGDQIRLPDFQAWIKWMVACGRIKLIGIRWGLTDLGKEVVPRIRNVDVEEFLEDEADEAAEDASDGEAETAAAGAGDALSPVASAPPAQDVTTVVASPAAGPTGAASAKAKSGAKKAAAKRTGADSTHQGDGASAATADEELLDLPPDAPPIDEAMFRAYEEKLTTTAAEPASAGVASGIPSEIGVSLPSMPRRILSPATLHAAGRLEIGCLREPAEPAEILTQLRTLGRERGIGGGSLLLAFGLETRMAHNEATRHLFLAALLARLFAARPDGALAELLVERAGALAPVAILLERPDSLAEVIVRWGLAMPDAASQQVRGILLDAVIGGRALASRPDLPTVLAETPNSEMLIGTLSSGLLRAAGPLGALWLVREMVRVGLWTRPSQREIAFVPSRAVRLMAYRLRLIDSHHAVSASRLLDVARKLAVLLPPGSVECAAFELLAPDDHLRFDCARLPICQEPCALHQDG